MALPFNLSIGVGNLLPQLMYWSFWLILMLVVITVCLSVNYYLKFRITGTIFETYSGSKEGMYSIGKPKKNKYRWIKRRTAWRPLFPLFNKQEIEPLDSNLLIQGNSFYAFKINDHLIPARIEINNNDNTIIAKISPIPHYVRNWQSIQQQLDEIEFAKTNFWNENKQVITILVFGLICLAMVLVTVYLTYKFAGGGTNAINALTQAINAKF